MSTYQWGALSPLLRESIELQPFNDFGVRSCGCEVRADRWRLCQYHEGFSDAEDIIFNVNAPEPEPVSEFDEPHKFGVTP